MIAHNPLSAWRCDKCGETVNAENGWLEWESDIKKGPRNFHIVHNRKECYFHDSSPNRKDNHLHYYLGAYGREDLLSFLYPGDFFVNNFTGGNWSYPDIPQFTEIFRRLHVPFYEEARIYLGQAYSNGDMEGANELTITSASFCKDIFEKYADDSDPLK